MQKLEKETVNKYDGETMNARDSETVIAMTVILVFVNMAKFWQSTYKQACAPSNNRDGNGWGPTARLDVQKDRRKVDVGAA